MRPMPSLADEHVMRLFGQHESAGPLQWFKAGFGERAELILSVAICKKRKGKKVQPVITRLVESLKDARLVGIATAALKQSIRLFASVTTEVGMQQIDHRPQMTAFLDVYLEQIAQIVERRTRATKLTLLLD